MAETKIPIILSTGMSGIKELNEALECFNVPHQYKHIALCFRISDKTFNVNLLSIKYLTENFPNIQLVIPIIQSEFLHQ